VPTTPSVRFFPFALSLLALTRLFPLQSVSVRPPSLLPTLHSFANPLPPTVASIFTRDISRALRYAKYIESGNVTVNVAAPLVDGFLPFGGYKQSGLSREGGSESVKRWLEEKVRFFLYLSCPEGVVLMRA
jgi:hypothetical protein